MKSWNQIIPWLVTGFFLSTGMTAGLPKAWGAGEEMPTFEMEEVKVSDTKITKPVVIEEVKPEYPMAARKAGVQGTSLFKIQVLPDGSVGEIQLLQSAGDSTLDTSAQKAVKKWKFKPGLSGSKPIMVYMTLPIKFELVKD